MYLDNDTLKKILDENVIDNFRNAIQKLPLYNFLFYGNLNTENFNLYNLLWSFYYSVEKIVDDLKYLDGIYYEKDLTFLFNCINKLNEGIDLIEEKFDWINFKYENKSLFLDNLRLFWQKIISIHNDKWTNEMDKYIDDDDLNFEYYRALLFHPFKTNRHPHCIKDKVTKECLPDIFKKYRFTQNAQDFFINDETHKRYIQFKIDCKYQVLIRIQPVGYSNENTNRSNKSKENNQYYFLYLDLDDLISYFRGKYESIISATDSLIQKNKELIEKSNFKCNWSLNNKEFLEQIINILKNNYVDSLDFINLLDRYNLFLDRKLVNNNYEVVSEYFNAVFKILREKINYLENYKYDDELPLFGFVNGLSLDEEINKTHNSSIDKIHSHLHGVRKGLMPNSDENASAVQCALNESLIFYSEFAINYIEMDIFDEKLTFLEIQLLFDVAIWKYKKLNHKL